MTNPPENFQPVCPVPDLGRKLPLDEVARLFEVAERTVKRQYDRYGGVKLGRKVLFFEKNVGTAIREQYATQANYQRTMDRAVVRSGQETGHTHPQGVRHQARRHRLGGRGQATGKKPRTTKVSRHGLRY